jgi:hypothetical protein
MSEYALIAARPAKLNPAAPVSAREAQRPLELIPMSNSPMSKWDTTWQVLLGVLMPQKLHQAIFNVTISSTPTKGSVSFSTVFDGVAFVTLYQNGTQIRGAFALPFAPSNYAVSFTGLPQDTELGLQIAVTDPRPPSQQLPGGIVLYSGILETGLWKSMLNRSTAKPILANTTSRKPRSKRAGMPVTQTHAA